MARVRNIKPGFFMNEALAQIDPLGRLLAAGLPCIADRKGRLEDRPVRIKAHLLPYDVCDVNGLLSALHDSGFIYRYEVDGLKLIQILKFSLHQTPHRHEPESSLSPPSPDEVRHIHECLGIDLDLDLDLDRKGVRGKPGFQGPDDRGNERAQHPKFPHLWFSELELKTIEKKLTEAGLLKNNHLHAFMKVEQWFCETTKGRNAHAKSSNHMRRVLDWGLKAALELQRTSDSAKLANGRLR